MNAFRLSALASVLALVVVACHTMPPPPADVARPDLRGVWSGTWGDTPLTLAIHREDPERGARGLYLGSWEVLAERRPAVAGILTFTLNGEPLSTSMQGWLGYSGTLKLVVEASAPSAGRQQLLLDVGDDQMTGTGTSSFRWGPQGAVNLTRVKTTPSRNETEPSGR